jgi:hypothetical protein
MPGSCIALRRHSAMWHAVNLPLAKRLSVPAETGCWITVGFLDFLRRTAGVIFRPLELVKVVPYAHAHRRFQLLHLSVFFNGKLKHSYMTQLNCNCGWVDKVELPHAFSNMWNIRGIHSDSMRHGVARTVYRRATGWTAWFLFPSGTTDFSFSTTSRPTLGPTQRLIHWVPGVKRQGLEADHSPPSVAEVENVGAIPPLPPRVIMA